MDGRQHNSAGFTIWMAGGGVKPGMRLGATDDIGFVAVGLFYVYKKGIFDWSNDRADL